MFQLQAQIKMSNSANSSISDQQLTDLTVRELNRYLKSSRFTKNQVQQMKQKRRTLKNRGYAAECRNKRFKRKGELEIQKLDELREIDLLSNKIVKYKDMISQVQSRLSECLLFAKHNNINLQLGNCEDFVGNKYDAGSINK